jgi:uncharacterized protein YaeQ
VALTATVHHFEIELSDVDRGVYQSLDLRVAQHPSETPRWLLTRTLAYCLCWEEGIAFSKGGLSDADEPPVSIRDPHDPAGRLQWWIDVGAPSAERLHKASKSARIAVFTHDLAQLRRQVAGHTIHRVETIDVWTIPPSFLDALAQKVERRARLEITRTEGALYVTVDGTTLETTLQRASLVSDGAT